MTSNTRKPDSLQLSGEMAVGFFNDWFDPARSIASVIEDLLCDELDAALVRPRYERSQMAGVNKLPKSHPLAENRHPIERPLSTSGQPFISRSPFPSAPIERIKSQAIVGLRGKSQEVENRRNV